MAAEVAMPVTLKDAIGKLSIIQPYGKGNSECGYCGSKEEKRVSYGAMAHQLTCMDYQKMIDFGWRRSGKYCYIPTNDETCCPNLTIRLDTDKFRPNKQQTKLLRRFNRFLKGEIDLLDKAPTDEMNASSTVTPYELHNSASEDAAMDHINSLLESVLRAAVDKSGLLPAGAPLDVKKSVSPVKPKIVETIKSLRSDGLGPLLCSSLPLSIFGALQREKTAAATSAADIAGTLCTIMGDLLREDALHAAELTAEASPNGIINFFFPLGKLSVFVDGKLLAVPVDAVAKTRRLSSNKPVPAPGKVCTPHDFRVDMVPAAFDKESYELYKQYQVAVHHDSPEECSEKQYTRFLCTSPLIAESCPPDIHYIKVSGGAHPAINSDVEAAWRRECDAWQVPEIHASNEGIAVPADQRIDEIQHVDISGADMHFGFGSFHHRYYLDNKLVAVGVVDVLPDCLLGKLTALREIQWVQRARQSYARLRYYYMGYYVHSCQKMRYKAEYSPSDLLCPTTREWVSYAEAVPALERERCPTLAGGVSATDVENIQSAHVADALSSLPNLVFFLGRAHPSMLISLKLGPALPPELISMIEQAFGELLGALPPHAADFMLGLIQ